MTIPATSTENGATPASAIPAAPQTPPGATGQPDPTLTGPPAITLPTSLEDCTPEQFKVMREDAENKAKWQASLHKKGESLNAAEAEIQRRENIVTQILAEESYGNLAVAPANLNQEADAGGTQGRQFLSDDMAGLAEVIEQNGRRQTELLEQVAKTIVQQEARTTQQRLRDMFPNVSTEGFTMASVLNNRGVDLGAAMSAVAQYEQAITQKALSGAGTQSTGNYQPAPPVQSPLPQMIQAQPQTAMPPQPIVPAASMAAYQQPNNTPKAGTLAFKDYARATLAQMDQARA